MKFKNIPDGDFFFIGFTFGIAILDILLGNGFWSLGLWVIISFMKLFLKDFLRGRKIRK